jgi:hypothetical protein
MLVLMPMLMLREWESQDNALRLNITTTNTTLFRMGGSDSYSGRKFLCGASTLL